MLEKVTTIEEGVRKLFTVRKQTIPHFTLTSRQQGEYTDILEWNGRRIPLLDSHFDMLIQNISEYGSNATQNSALHVYSFRGNNITLSQLIYQEIDIAEYILHSRVKKITAFVNKNAVSLIAVMENGTCANMDLGNSMTPGSQNQCQHRLITKHGMANDRIVGNMTFQHQINVYGVDSAVPVTYDDDEYYLYGLSDEQIRKVAAVYAVLTGNEAYDVWIKNDIRYQAIVEAVYESDKQGKTVYLL